MTERTKEELKLDKAARIKLMSLRAIEMINDLIDDVEVWSTRECSSEERIEHSMHQNETVANLQFFIDYLQNRPRTKGD